MRVIIHSQLVVCEYQSHERAQIIAENTFVNPAYTQALEMGYSTRQIDKEIVLYQEDQEQLYLPRGYWHYLPTHELVDQRTVTPTDHGALREITLRDYQQQAVYQAIQHQQGVIQAGTGSGKTLMGLEIICQQKQRSLILTHSRELMRQWQQQIKTCLDLECGIIGNGQQTQADITIAMLQTLNKRSQLCAQLSQNYGLVLVDECHHIPSATFARVISQLACQYRYGLTATPTRRDGMQQLIFRHMGDIITSIADHKIHASGGIVPVTIKRIDTDRVYQAISWQEYIQQLIADTQRNLQIVGIAYKSASSVPTLILTDRIAHAQELAQLYQQNHADKPCLLVHGQLPMKERRARMEKISAYSLVIGTTGLLGEGLDIACWTVLILATPISSKVKLLQAIGRVMRPSKDKRRAYVADLVDHCRFSLSSYKKRWLIYREKGFQLRY